MAGRPSATFGRNSMPRVQTRRCGEDPDRTSFLTLRHCVSAREMIPNSGWDPGTHNRNRHSRKKRKKAKEKRKGAESQSLF